MFRMLRALTVPAILALTAAEGAADAAHVVATRSGQTPRGETRVVFETDRAVEYLAVEMPSAKGLELHLLDVDGTSLPRPLVPRGNLIERVDFRGTATGIVAEIAGTGAALRAEVFSLKDPPRVVVDLAPSSGPAPSSHANPSSGPAPSSSTGSSRRLAPPVSVSKTGSSGPVTPTPAANGSIFEDTDAESVAAARRAVPQEEDFEDLLVWIHALQSTAKALNAAEREGERALYRRRLGYLLVQRGLLMEGERALLSAAQGQGHDPATAVTDSVAIAEIRLESGRLESASEIARAVDTARATPGERLRLASVLVETGQPTLAASLAEATLDKLEGSERARGVLVLARAQRKDGHVEQARRTVRPLTNGSAAPASLLPEALLLHADCEFELGRARDAERLYDRAAKLALPDEDASWVALQLGNLARRAGRRDEARAKWRMAAEQYPETFYASQAAWFLRVSDAVEKLNEAQADGSRG